MRLASHGVEEGPSWKHRCWEIYRAGYMLEGAGVLSVHRVSLAVFTWPCTMPGAVRVQKKEVGPKTYSLEHNVFTRLRLCFVLFR